MVKVLWKETAFPRCKATDRQTDAVTVNLFLLCPEWLLILGALFYSSVKCTGAPKYPHKTMQGFFGPALELVLQLGGSTIIITHRQTEAGRQTWASWVLSWRQSSSRDTGATDAAIHCMTAINNCSSALLTLVRTMHATPSYHTHYKLLIINYAVINNCSSLPVTLVGSTHATPSYHTHINYTSHSH